MNMTAWIITAAAALLGYLAIGVGLTRYWVEQAFRALRQKGQTMDRARKEATEDLWLPICFWPVGVAILYIAQPIRDHLGGFVTGGIDEQINRAAQLTTEARQWDEAAKRADVTDAEKDMASQLAQMCRDLAKEATK